MTGQEKVRFRLFSLALVAFFGLPTLAWAQPPEPEFMKALFPPELIMRHGREVGLSKDQRRAITDAVVKTQAKTLELQWDMQDAAQSLAALITKDRVDEKSALAVAAQVMEIEGRVKRAHLGLLIQIKNQLEPEQQKKLRELREGG